MHSKKSHIMRILNFQLWKKVLIDYDAEMAPPETLHCIYQENQAYTLAYHVGWADINTSINGDFLSILHNNYIAYHNEN